MIFSCALAFKIALSLSGYTHRSMSCYPASLRRSHIQATTTAQDAPLLVAVRPAPPGVGRKHNTGISVSSGTEDHGSTRFGWTTACGHRKEILYATLISC